MNVFSSCFTLQDLLKGRVHATRLSGAMTNLVFKLENDRTTAAVIVRIFGEATLLFSRHQERGIFALASQLGLGPRCLFEFSNGRIEECLPGGPLTAESIRQPAVARAIARELARFHVLMSLQDNVQDSHPVSPATVPRFSSDALNTTRMHLTTAGNAFWGRLRDWLKTALELAPGESSVMGLDGAMHEIEAMEREICRRFQPPWHVMAHNDLQYGNIIEQPNCRSEGEVQPRVKLIDYEYACVNEVGFDVANHFAEYAANYHRANTAEVLDWSALPTEIERRRFCYAYVKAVLEEHGNSQLAAAMGNTAGDGALMIEAATSALLHRAAAFGPLSDLKWGLWGLLQAKMSANSSFDYMAYAKVRLERYHIRKKATLTIVP
jgi:thiamine kinase-like enzyme